MILGQPKSLDEFHPLAPEEVAYLATPLLNLMPAEVGQGLATPPAFDVPEGVVVLAHRDATPPVHPPEDAADLAGAKRALIDGIAGWNVRNIVAPRHRGRTMDGEGRSHQHGSRRERARAVQAHDLNGLRASLHPVAAIM